MSRPRPVSRPPARAKTQPELSPEGERLKAIARSIGYLPDRLDELQAHLTDLSNLVYEQDQRGDTNDGGVLMAAWCLLGKYADDVRDYAEHVRKISAMACSEQLKPAAEGGAA